MGVSGGWEEEEERGRIGHATCHLLPLPVNQADTGKDKHYLKIICVSLAVKREEEY